MAIEIINRQTTKRLDVRVVRKQIEEILSTLGISGRSACFLLCDRRGIIKLNKKYFNRSAYTDVISFPLADKVNPDYLGDAAVSVEEAVKACRQYGNSWQDELLLYLVHAVLHLLGYDDIVPAKRRRMEKKQQEVFDCVKTRKR